jgi:hypothetical protein
MNVTYILHSSYLVESENSYMLFDYFDGELPEMNYNKTIYFFASHSHGDHFSEKIFDAAENFKEAYFILSNDIFEHRVPEKYMDNTVFVGCREIYEIGEMKVETLKSTDLGVAYLVECAGKLIYHAGDLNCWVWAGAPDKDNDIMSRWYAKEILRLSGRNIHIAFVPLDPHQEQYFHLGLAGFIEAANAENIFPMHMWDDDFSVIKRFKELPEFEEYKGKIHDIKARLQSFTV